MKQTMPVCINRSTGSYFLNITSEICQFGIFLITFAVFFQRTDKTYELKNSRTRIYDGKNLEMVWEER